MNKAAIQHFAMKARTDLIEQVSQRAYQYGITKEGYGDANAVTVGGRALNTDEQRQRKELVEQIRQKGYTQVMEEVAYTWFNRFIALRFMEVNNYLPSHIRIFSDSTGAFKPEILNDVLHLDLPGLNAEKVAAYIENNQTEDLYRHLLLTQCNALNDALPQMFEQMGGYTELLLPNNILKQDSVLGRMVTDIPEADWTDQVQIIGWLYQYYNSELKDDTFALLKKNVKITKERIPSATQLFTPDWIVRYMVENSLGRLWLEGHPDDELKTGWKYYLDEVQQEADVQAQLEEIRAEYRNIKPQDIKVIDPCMGSGHILVYAFDVLVQIYKKYGISERDAAQSILENNLYGLDIDDRAAQLAYFAVMMKARQYDRRIFSRGIQPHVHSIMETNTLGGSYKLAMGDFLLSKEHQETLNYLLDAFLDAKEYGSILQLEDRDYEGLMEAWKYTASQTAENINMTLWYSAVEHEIPKIIEQAIMLTQKYDVVVTNPPYMGSDSMSAKLKDFVTKNYYDLRYDIYAVFIKRCLSMKKPRGLVSMITQNSFLFALCFDRLRDELIHSTSIVNAVHLGPRAFEDISGEVVQTIAVIFSQKIQKRKSRFIRLVDYTENKELHFHTETPYEIDCAFFSKLPNSVFAYSLSNAMKRLCLNGSKIGDIFVSKAGVVTGRDDYFLRYWHEPDYSEFDLHANDASSKYVPFSKGGTFVKWYGNIAYALKLADLWNDTKVNKSVRRGDKSAYFQKCIGWSYMGGGNNKYFSTLADCVCGTGTPTILCDNEDTYLYTLGFLNTKIPQRFIELFNPTLNTYASDICNLPYVDHVEKEHIIELVKECIDIARSNWDSFEISWDFSVHPLVLASYTPDLNGSHKATLDQSYATWKKDCEERFNKLKSNEEELNRIFIDIYGLQDELAPEVEDKDVTVRKADLGRDIRSLISYAVGCMFGRYSLDVEGLAYAGGEWDASKYSTYTPDKDNIIPICDDDYFDDDITGRFVKWVETVYGSETLEENLKFIADALGGKGTPREVIRSYFINGFYADHLKIYQKRPIYWLFDSGKKNGFKALIYMHRYQSDLLARMRTDYVHEQQERYRTQLMHIANAIDHAGAAERVKLTKQQKKLQEQSLEIQKYEEKIHHLADQNIQIDLDDGVNHNYELFADVLAKRK